MPIGIKKSKRTNFTFFITFFLISKKRCVYEKVGCQIVKWVEILKEKGYKK